MSKATELVFTWKEKIFPKMRNILIKTDDSIAGNNFYLPKELRELTNELNICFVDEILAQFSDDDLQELENNMLAIRNIINKLDSAKAIDEKGERSIFYLNENEQKYKDALTTLRRLFDKLGFIDAYLTAYRGTMKKLDIVISEAEKEHDKKMKIFLGEIAEGYLFSEFKKQADNIDCRITISTIIFFLVIIGLILAAIQSLTHLPSFQGNDWIPYLSTRIFIAFTAFYALTFLNRSIRDNRKLEQTYRHKEVVSKSYLNYLDFLDTGEGKFSENNQVIKDTVSKIAAESLGLNPALLLEKSTAEKIPMEELLLKIIDNSKKSD